MAKLAKLGSRAADIPWFEARRTIVASFLYVGKTGVSQNQGYFFGGSYSKDYGISGVYIGVFLFGETTILLQYFLECMLPQNKAIHSFSTYSSAHTSRELTDAPQIVLAARCLGY